MSAAHDSAQAGPFLHRREGGLLLAGALAALVAAGCLPAPGADNAFYVLVPYAASMLAVLLSAFALFGLSPSPRRGAVADKRGGAAGMGADKGGGAARLARRALAGAVATGMTAAGEVAHLLRGGAGEDFGYRLPGEGDVAAGALPAIAYALLALAACACFVRLRQRARANPPE